MASEIENVIDTDEFEHPQKKKTQKEKAAHEWLKAVSEDNPVLATRLAGEIIPKRRGKLVDLFYAKFAKLEGIGASFFDRGFDEFDFDLWKHAYFFHNLGREITKGDLNNVARLHKAVVRKIEGREKKEELVNWP